MTIIRYDANDFLRSIYGADKVEEYLYRDGGKSLWDLYFHTAQVHSRICRDFQLSFLEEDSDRNYMIDPHYLLPCCDFDLNKPEMTEEDADGLFAMMGSIVDGKTYKEVMYLLDRYCMSEKNRQQLLEMLIEKYDTYEDDSCLYNAKAICQKHLSVIYPHSEEIIKERTTDAVLIYTDLINTKAKMLHKFIKFYESGFKSLTVFFGLDLLDYAVRTHYSNGQGNVSKKMAELLENLDDFSQIYPQEEDITDETELWRAIIEYDPDDEQNCYMFNQQLSYMITDPDKERLNYLEYFMSKTDKLKKYYGDHPETVVAVYMYRKQTVNHDLLVRLADTPYKEFTLMNGDHHLGRKMEISKMDVLILFLNMYPGFEDRRKIIPEEVLDEVIRRTFFPVTEITTVELIDLLVYSRKYRLKDADLVCWTEAYFEELFKTIS